MYLYIGPLLSTTSSCRRTSHNNPIYIAVASIYYINTRQTTIDSSIALTHLSSALACPLHRHARCSSPTAPALPHAMDTATATPAAAAAQAAPATEGKTEGTTLSLALPLGTRPRLAAVGAIASALRPADDAMHARWWLHLWSLAIFLDARDAVRQPWWRCRPGAALPTAVSWLVLWIVVIVTECQNAMGRMQPRMEQTAACQGDIRVLEYYTVLVQERQQYNSITVLNCYCSR